MSDDAVDVHQREVAEDVDNAPDQDNGDGVAQPAAAGTLPERPILHSSSWSEDHDAALADHKKMLQYLMILDAFFEVNQTAKDKKHHANEVKWVHGKISLLTQMVDMHEKQLAAATAKLRHEAASNATASLAKGHQVAEERDSSSASSSLHGQVSKFPLHAFKTLGKFNPTNVLINQYLVNWEQTAVAAMQIQGNNSKIEEAKSYVFPSWFIMYCIEDDKMKQVYLKWLTETESRDWEALKDHIVRSHDSPAYQQRIRTVFNSLRLVYETNNRLSVEQQVETYFAHLAELKKLPDWQEAMAKALDPQDQLHFLQFAGALGKDVIQTLIQIEVQRRVELTKSWQEARDLGQERHKHFSVETLAIALLTSANVKLCYTGAGAEVTLGPKPLSVPSNGMAPTNMNKPPKQQAPAAAASAAASATPAAQAKIAELATAAQLQRQEDVAKGNCFCCHQPGHATFDCPKQVCTFCSKQGHPAEKCMNQSTTQAMRDQAKASREAARAQKLFKQGKFGSSAHVQLVDPETLDQDSWVKYHLFGGEHDLHATKNLQKVVTSAHVQTGPTTQPTRLEHPAMAQDTRAEFVAK